MNNKRCFFHPYLSEITRVFEVLMLGTGGEDQIDISYYITVSQVYAV